MPVFSEESKIKLRQCHPALQLIFNEVIKCFDCKVLCGYRTEAEQNQAVAERKSKTPWPKSKHNSFPALAVDVAPCPIDWDDSARFYYFGGFVIGMATRMGFRIRYGGDWDSDTQVKDESFKDLPHFEVVEG